MVPLIVQAIVTLLAKIRLGWRDAARTGIAAMIVFTAISHFAPSMARDMANMIPPPLTGALWVIYATGALELLGAIGLMIPRFRRAAGICLILLLIALFPANVYAAMHGVTLGGRAPTPLWIRTPLQVFWIFVLWWSAVARPRAQGDTLFSRA